MPKKSIYAQLDASAVNPRSLHPSPRHWNPGLLFYRDKFWMAYRYHRAETGDARCGIAIVQIDPMTGETIGKSQRIALKGPTDTEHHEDCRLFMFRGEPMISYTEMTGYQPGVDYTCVMKYAQLRLIGVRWSVVDQWQPRYGANTGYAKEKNWIFFESGGELHCVYSPGPEHVVLKIEEDKVVTEYRTAGALWQWGSMRGGTPPVEYGDGELLSVFHSSLPTEVPPHFVRYFGGAYAFENKAPFRITRISELPIMAGSEADQHKVDPRYVAGWKPFVTFPCGLVRHGSRLFCSLGVNDWQCAIARLEESQFSLGAPDGSSFKPRFFRSPNASRPVKYTGADQKPVFLHWTPAKSRIGCAVSNGVLKIATAREAAEVAEYPGAEEIGADEFDRMMRSIKR